mgnify:CR=1 FL=1
MASEFDIGKAFSRLVGKMKKNKKLELMVYGSLIALGVLLFVLIPGGGNGTDPPKETEHEQKQAETELEGRLEAVLSSIRGAGKVKVMITYDTSSRLVPAMSTDVQSGTTENRGTGSESITQTRTESSRPATVSTSGGAIEPTIRGVIVIAEGAADVSVRLKLQNAVITVLGITAERIDVFEMKSNNEEE